MQSSNSSRVEDLSSYVTPVGSTGDVFGRGIGRGMGICTVHTYISFTSQDSVRSAPSSFFLLRYVTARVGRAC